MPGAEQVLIFGVGNPLYGDDGLGNRIIEILAEKYRLPDSVKLIDSGALTDLIDFMSDYEHMIVIDTILMGKAPGEITTFSLNEMSIPYNPLSHSTGLLEALKKMEGLPPAFFICAEPFNLSLGSQLSDILVEKIPCIIKIIVERLNSHGLQIKFISDK